MKHNLNTKGRNRQNSHMVGYCKKLFSVVERTSRQKNQYYDGRHEKNYQLSCSD